MTNHSPKIAGTFHERPKVVDSLPGYTSDIAACRRNLAPRATHSLHGPIPQRRALTKSGWCYTFSYCYITTSLLTRGSREEGSYILTDRCSVLSAMPFKARQLVTMLLVCVALGAIVCQYHITPIDSERSAPSEHRSTASAHSTLHFCCQAAVLSAIMFFALLICFLLYVNLLGLKYTAPVFPPFRPPRHAY